MQPCLLLSTRANSIKGDFQKDSQDLGKSESPKACPVLLPVSFAVQQLESCWDDNRHHAQNAHVLHGLDEKRRCIQ